MENHGTFIDFGKIIDFWKFRWNFHHRHLINPLCSLLFPDVPCYGGSLNIFLSISALPRWFGQHQCKRSQQSDVGLPDDSDPGWTRDSRVLRADVRMDEPDHNHVITSFYFTFKLLTVATRWIAEKSSQLGKHSFGSQLHNLTRACSRSKGILLQHRLRFTNEVD